MKYTEMNQKAEYYGGVIAGAYFFVLLRRVGLTPRLPGYRVSTNNKERGTNAYYNSNLPRPYRGHRKMV